MKRNAYNKVADTRRLQGWADNKGARDTSARNNAHFAIPEITSN